MSGCFSLHSTPEPHEETGLSPCSGCVSVRHARRRAAPGWPGPPGSHAQPPLLLHWGWSQKPPALKQERETQLSTQRCSSI